MLVFTKNKALTPLVLIVFLAGRTDTEPRQGSKRSFSNQGTRGTNNNQIGRQRTYRGRVQCPKVMSYSMSRAGNGCVSKYECEKVCNSEKVCKTRYEYKCTDYKRRECKDVWQNKCNGKKSKRSVEDYQEPGTQGQLLHRVKRLIDTEVVFDQSYPIPPSDLPFASDTVGQIFDFASPPKSRQCWKKVRKCEWKKYRSSCRNQPVKTCENKLTQVCKNKCKRVYYCNKCPTTTPTTKPPRPNPVGPPAPPPAGTFVIGPPAPPSKLDVIVDTRRTKRYRGRRVP